MVGDASPETSFVTTLALCVCFLLVFVGVLFVLDKKKNNSETEMMIDDDDSVKIDPNWPIF